MVGGLTLGYQMGSVICSVFETLTARYFLLK